MLKMEEVKVDALPNWRVLVPNQQHFSIGSAEIVGSVLLPAYTEEK